MSAYRHMMPKVGSVLALAAVFAVGTAEPTQAAHLLRLTQGANVIEIADGGGLDLDPNPGIILFSGPVGLFTVNVTAGFSKGAPGFGSASEPKMDLLSGNVSGGAGALQIEHTDTDFGPPVSGFSLHLGGGSLAPGGAVTYSGFFDQSNVVYGRGSLIATLGPLSGGAFSASGSGNGPLSSPYSLTQLVTITHGGAGFTSLDAALVPEPATLVLFGVGLMTLGLVARRRRSVLLQ